LINDGEPDAAMKFGWVPVDSTVSGYLAVLALSVNGTQCPARVNRCVPSQRQS
jgi:hypothetical protein